MKKSLKVIIILLCAFILLGLCYFFKGYFNGDYSEVKYGDVIKNGRYIYFAYYNMVDGKISNGALLKVSKDGKKITTLKNTCVSRLSIYRGKLYFLSDNGLCRMNVDGSGDYKVIDTMGSGDYYINKDRIYYSKDIEGIIDIYSCNVDLKDKKTIIKGMKSFEIYNDKVYTAVNINRNSTIVQEWDLNGKFIRNVAYMGKSYFEICDGKLFFCQAKFVNRGTSTIDIGSPIYSINIKTGKKQEIIKDNAGAFIIKEGKIYYDAVDINPNASEDDPNKCIYTSYVCNLDGKEKKKPNELASLIAVCSCIDGNSLYYLDEKENLVVRSIKGGKAKIIVPNEKLKNLKTGQ